MKHSIIVKFLAILLAAFSLVAAVGGAVGIVAMESSGLYVNGLELLQDQEYESIARDVSNGYAKLYAVQTLGQLPYQLRQSLYNDPADRGDADHWAVRLAAEGEILSESGQKTAFETYSYIQEYTIAPLYVIASLYSPDDLDEMQESTAPTVDSTEAAPEGPGSIYEEIAVPEDYLYATKETSLEAGKLVTYYLYYYQAPEYQVTVYLQEEVLDSSALHILTDMYPHRYTFIGILAVGLLLAAVCVVYLLCAAGHCADGSIRPGGLNRLPLDLYALLCTGGIAALFALLSYLWNWVENEGPHLGNLSLIAVNLEGIALLAIAFLFAFAAQVKAGNGFWWHHSVTGFLCRKIAAGFRFLNRCISTVMRMLPLIWQWLLTAFVMVLSVVITFMQYLANIDSTFLEFFFLLLFLADLLVCVGIVVYSGYCFGTLMKGAKRMSEGDLGCKISTRYLRGNFRSFADQLNALSETALIAAKKQMQSERMKSELITNVSHDIKTPLTSIINFVDLLQKPHSEAQEQEYLDVLARQSSRMKKLIDDLMELSKASSGSITVNLQQLDAAETVNQALGEFSDKLEAAGLTPIFHQPQERILITADGRLVWRVLSNLLTNAIKYALPGTRLYIDLVQVEDRVLLSLKNISRAELNVPAEELMERFVRGDVSRKSEGSGLGLNIAKNLMEVQGGQLQLLLDGDLFKVTLIFPTTEE